MNALRKGTIMAFDISSIQNAYADYVSQNAQNIKSDDIAANRNYAKATDDELMDACKKFEAYFLEQCFKEMWKSTGATESESASTNMLKEYYEENLISELATQSTEKQSLGLAQMLYEQMKRNYDL